MELLLPHRDGDAAVASSTASSADVRWRDNGGMTAFHAAAAAGQGRYSMALKFFGPFSLPSKKLLTEIPPSKTSFTHALLANELSGLFWLFFNAIDYIELPQISVLGLLLESLDDGGDVQNMLDNDGCVKCSYSDSGFPLIRG